MSKRAEKVALKAYPDRIVNDVALVFSEQRRIFQEGYEQAEKDMIERACEWLEQALTLGCHPCSCSRLVMEFRKAMEDE